MSDTPGADTLELERRITEYLTGGGLFNPEMADHEAVRDLLLDCRAGFKEQRAREASLRAEKEELRRERDEARAYAHEATKAITGLTPGGSEYFGKQLWKGGDYTADIPFCVERIRERMADRHQVKIGEVQIRQCVARAEAAESLLAEAGKALEPFAKSFDGRRDAHSRRHADRDLGYARFDKMPDEWPIEPAVFSMGAYRRARSVSTRIASLAISGAAPQAVEDAR